jgi:ribosomal-protein-alanine N-acetyltransferase
VRTPRFQQNRVVSGIETERLRLVPLPALHDRAALETAVGARLPEDWPGEDIAGYVPTYVIAASADPGLVGWGIWLMIVRELGVVAGDLGFKGTPDAGGTVEIGYAVLPAYRRRGYATEAVTALVAWAFARPEVVRVVAKCDPDNVPSIRILDRLGMSRTGERDGLITWELRT